MSGIWSLWNTIFRKKRRSLFNQDGKNLPGPGPHIRVGRYPIQQNAVFLLEPGILMMGDARQALDQAAHPPAFMLRPQRKIQPSHFLSAHHGNQEHQ